MCSGSSGGVKCLIRAGGGRLSRKRRNPCWLPSNTPLQHFLISNHDLLSVNASDYLGYLTWKYTIYNWGYTGLLRFESLARSSVSFLRVQLFWQSSLPQKPAPSILQTRNIIKTILFRPLPKLFYSEVSNFPSNSCNFTYRVWSQIRYPSSLRWTWSTKCSFVIPKGASIQWILCPIPRFLSKPLSMPRSNSFDSSTYWSPTSFRLKSSHAMIWLLGEIERSDWSSNR